MRAFLPTPPLPILRAKTPRFAPPVCSASRHTSSPFEPFDDSVLIDDSSSEQYLHILLNSKPSRSDLLPKTRAPAKSSKQTSPKRRSRRHGPHANASQVQGSKKGVQIGDGVKKGMWTGAGTDMDDRLARAPNGLVGSGDGSEPEDFLQELLPILAKAEREEEEKRMRTGEEKETYDKICAAVDLFASMHRNSGKLRNLRPFRLKEEKEETCKTCGGSGMTTCSYCKGEGFVDLGENGEKFQEEFENNFLTMPKKVMGSIYHCPLCGGLKEERCVTCYGMGTARTGGEELGRYEAESSFEDGDIEAFDFESLLKQERDRIEVGVDGTIVMRAKKAKRPGRKGKKGESVAEVDKKKRKRGRPSKTRIEGQLKEEGMAESKADLPRLVPEAAELTRRKRSPLRKIKASVGRTTDFVNTTDYKVGRRLVQGSGGNEKKGLSRANEGIDKETASD